MRTTLGNVVDIILGGTPKTKIAEYWNGDIPWVTIEDFYQGKKICKTEKYITEFGLNNSNTKLLNEGDIIISARGTVGKIIVCGTQLTFSQSCYALRSKTLNKLSQEFLYYLMWNSVAYLKQRAVGGVFNTIIKATLESVPIDLPPLPTQKRIADILSAYDDLIENNNRRIALLEQAARHLYKEWFVRFKFPGHEKVKIVDGVPEGWERRSFSEVVSINPRETINKNKNIRFVPMKALDTGSLIINENDIELRKKTSGAKFRLGDTLFARIALCLENGKTGFVDFLETGEIGSGSTEFIVFREKILSKYFIYLISREDGFRSNALKSVTGSTRQRVQTSCFDKYTLSIPPKLIMKYFNDEVKPMFDQIFVLKNQNKKLKTARNLLLPKLISGNLGV